MLVGLVFLVFKSLLGFARLRSRTKFTIWTLKLRSHVRMSIYRRSAIFDCDSETLDHTLFPLT